MQISDSFNLPAVAFMVVIILGVLAAVVGSLVRATRHNQARAQRLQQAGFTPLAVPPPELVERITRLYQGSFRPGLQVSNVFQKNIVDGQAVFFDIHDASDSDSTWAENEVLGIISPDLDLPQWLLQPRPAGMQISGAAGKLLDWVMNKTGFRRVELTEQPQLDQLFIVFARDEAAVRQYFTPQRADQLASLPRAYQIQAAGDMFAISQAHLPAQNNPVALPEQKTQFLLADAQRILAALH